MFRSWLRFFERRPAKRRPTARPQVECLEDRITPATIVVTDIGDTVAVDGKVTLREAIQSANGNANVNADVVAVGAYGNDTINFNIGGGGAATITLDNPIPITDPATINGYSQGGASVNTLATGNNAVIKITVSGNNVLFAGLWIQTSNTTIQGLSVVNFTNDGIRIQGGAGRTNNKIVGNFIVSNGQDGVYLSEGATGNFIGGTNVADRNWIAINGWNGIHISGGGTNTVVNNYIGTGQDGTGSAPNSENGIRLNGSSTNLIGGTVNEARNIISGNSKSGILVEGTSSVDNIIKRNYIGLDRDGTNAVGNGEEGIKIVDASRTIIGAADPDKSKPAGNMISGNAQHGVLITGANATGNKLIGNYIGTDKSGGTARENTKAESRSTAPTATSSGTERK